jgi:hypothetical protein
MRDVYHQYRGGLCSEILLPDLEIIFPNGKRFDAPVDLCLPDAVCKINLMDGITKLERPEISIGFIPLAAFPCLVLTGFTLLQFTKDLLQTLLTNGLFSFTRYLEFAIYIDRSLSDTDGRVHSTS